MYIEVQHTQRLHLPLYSQWVLVGGEESEEKRIKEEQLPDWIPLTERKRFFLPIFRRPMTAGCSLESGMGTNSHTYSQSVLTKYVRQDQLHVR